MPYSKGFFKGKKITVMGLGLLGRGLGDVKFLAEEGAELVVTDLKSPEELAPSIEELKIYKNITYVLGDHRKEDFEHKDFILKAAGVPVDSPYIAHARKSGVPVEMSTSLFASLTPAMLVGVTGTRGKSTTSHLIHDILKNAFGSTKKILLGGNVRGVSTLPFLKLAGPEDVVVLELDSWQLQGFGERKISPHVAVFTTFLPDHLNYYKGSLDAYLADKANIFKNQSSEDYLILGRQAAPLVKEKYAPYIKAALLEVDNHDLPKDWKVNIPGLHNRYNAAMAMAAANVLGVDINIIRKTIEDFKGVPGRLEFVKEIDGVKIYNDTTATTPDATLAAMRAFGIGRNNILIFGGADKGLEMGHLFRDMSDYVKSVVLLPGTGSARVEHDLNNIENVRVEKVTTLEEAVKTALKLSMKGDTILFSPGFASFGMFKNEFDRGDKFNEIVEKIIP